MNQQRKVVYDIRNQALNEDDITEAINEMVSDYIDEELDTEVTLYDDNVGRYYPVSKLTVNNIDPDFPPLIYMEMYFYIERLDFQKDLETKNLLLVG